MKYVIIGCSAAGLSGLETIRERDPEAEIVIITADKDRPYSRILTSYLLGGVIDEEDIYLCSGDYFQKMGVEVLNQERVIYIKSSEKVLELASGKVISFDKLLIATGASPALPDYSQGDLKGVFTLRNLEDIKEMEAYINNNGVRHCLLLGGGLVSLKAAEAFYRRGLENTIIIRSPRVLSQMLDPAAAAIVEDYLLEKGFNILKGEAVKEIRGETRVEGVKLESGNYIKGDLVLIGKGVRPNTDFVDSAIEVDNGGIVVDKHLETTALDIYAAGDVAVSRDFLSGERTNNAIWPDAVWQGRAAARSMTGRKIDYEGGLSLNSLKILDLKVFAAGKVKFYPEEKDSYSVYVKNIPEMGCYRKLVFKDGVLTGAIVTGQSEDIGTLYTLIKKRLKIEAQAQKILKHGISYAELVKDKLLI